ncbi:MAG: ribonuclease Z [Desulfurococcaceae archaeon TW002]
MNPVIVTFLGSRGPYPGSDDMPSVLISYGGKNILLDVGEGTQHRLLEVGKSIASINIVLITHMHGDHVLGLIPLLQSRSLAGITTPILIIGPAGLGTYLIKSFEYLYFYPEYKLVVNEISDGDVCEGREDLVEPLKELAHDLGNRVSIVSTNFCKTIVEGPFKIRAFWVKHSIPTLAYRVDVSEAISICYVSDTIPSDNVVKMCSNVKVLVHDSTFSSDMSDKAREYAHSTATQASETALKCGAEMLILYHVSPRYKNTETLLNEARKTFKNTYVAEKYMKLYLIPNK